MGDGAGGRQRQRRHYRQNGRDSHRGHEAEHEIAAKGALAAAEILRQERERQVAALVGSANRVLPDEVRGS